MNQPLPNRTHEKGDADVNDVALKIFLATSPYTAEAFFRSVTSALTTSIPVKFAYVSELLGEIDKARIIAIAQNGEQLQPFEYDLAGTPCENVLTNTSAAYRDSVARRFPASSFLTEVGAEAFIAEPLCSASGDAVGIVGLIHDTPIVDLAPFQAVLHQVAPRIAAELERRQRGNTLRRSEARLRLLIEHAKDAMFYCRMAPSPAIEYVNPAVEELTGYPPEVFTANYETGIRLFNKEDRQRIADSLRNDSRDPVIVKINRADGKTAWVDCRVFPFYDSDGSLVGVGGTVHDLTFRIEAEQELEESEQYRRALLQAIPDTIFRFNAEGTLLDFVPGEATADILPSPLSQSGRDVSELLPNAFSAKARNLIQAALRSGQMQRLEFEAPLDNQFKFYEALCLPFGGDEALLVLRDFTAVKWHQGEDERQRIREELDQKVEKRIQTNPYSLTFRELAILHLVADGAADKQIAESMGISTHTVNKHVGNILAKMSAASRTEAGVRAIREGLVA